jgi:hypothetical protein
VLVNVVVQFTSTLLISDTTNWPVPGSEEKRSIPFAVEMDGIDSRYGLYQAPSQFSFFAEGTRSVSAFKVMDDNEFRDWRDSGSYVRALIPLFEFERPSLVKYRGPALAMDSHVLCIAQGLEQLEATLKYEYFDPLDRKKKFIDDPDEVSLHDGAHITPSITFKESVSWPLGIVRSDRQRYGNYPVINAALETKLASSCNSTIGVTTICPLETSEYGPGAPNGTFFNIAPPSDFPEPLDRFPTKSFMDVSNTWLMISRLTITNSSSNILHPSGMMTGAIMSTLRSGAKFNGSE